MKPVHDAKRIKKTKTLEDVFKQLNRDHVQIKTKDRKCNNKVLYSILEELLKRMRKSDEMFRSMKPVLEYLGSYFDGLRVGQPTEYDINLMLKLPLNYEKIILDARESSHDYTNIFMSSEFRRLSKTPATAEKGFVKTRSWCDSNYRLSVKKFRSWMQSVVDAAVADLPVINGRKMLCVNNKYYQISTKMSGPANTITIISVPNDDNVIDVDLVPTFAFKLPKKPMNSNVRFDTIEESAKKNANLKEYFVVPKPSENDFSWRLTFPFQERFYIDKKNNLKSTLKLLKLLRDVQGFKKLASYYIKSVFLWETSQTNDDFWKKNSLSFLVIYMLKKLRDCLAIGEIKNFWCPENNLLFGKVKMETCRNWSNRLSYIISKIEENGKRNPLIVLEYFTKSPMPKS